MCLLLWNIHIVCTRTCFPVCFGRKFLSELQVRWVYSYEENVMPKPADYKEKKQIPSVTIKPHHQHQDKLRTAP